ncbi:MAG: hypothetical protein WCA79_01905 [Anaerolineales bacterium]
MNTFAVGSIVVSIACAFVFILAFVLLMILLGLLSNFFKRCAALENTDWLGVLGFFKGIFWPALLVYELLKYLHL